MTSLSGRGERPVTGGHGSCEVQHHCEPAAFFASVKATERRQQPNKERPAPVGAGGWRQGDPYPNLSLRAEAAGLGSYSSLPGSSIGERINSTMWFGAGTLCRGSRADSASLGKSERKVGCCEKCSATLVALKKQALSLAVHHQFSCKDSSDLSAFLNANLRVHTRSTLESREREREQGQCTACGTNVNQLKHEAVHLALSRGHSSAKPPFDHSLSASSLLGINETRHADRAAREPDVAAHQSPGRTHCPQSPRTPQRTPQTLRRRGLKPANPDMDRWVEEQQQLAAYKSVSNADGVTMYSYHKAGGDANPGRGDAGTLQTSSKIPHISRVVNIANTAAMSFLAKAAEKLSLTLRKKGQASDSAPAHLSTRFRDIIQKNPPSVPSCLLQAATRTRDSPNVGKVKVVLRVSPTLSADQGQSPVLQIDPAKKRVTIREPFGNCLPQTAMVLGRDGKNLLKTFNFDATYSQESSQAEVCAGVLADVIRCVLSGSDGCVLGLGCADVGSWSSMVGSDESVQKLGLIPCAISWLYSSIERRREKTWTDMTVSVSAIELCCGEEDTLRDLLGEFSPLVGSAQDSPQPRIRLQEDPVYGIQLRNHNRVKAPTAERAASLLDVAIAARRHSDFITYLSHTSVMFFTLHVQPPRTESSTIGKGLRGPTKLILIDVSSGMRAMSKNKPPYSELGPVIVSLLSGHKTPPNRGSKLTMLLREALGHTNCHVTVMAEIADSLTHLQETLSTVHLAARIRRTQKRTKQSTSCSPCGRSLTRQKKGPQPFSLRAFHSTDEVDVDNYPLRLRGDLDEHSGSEQSCDTVIQIGSDGFINSKAAGLTQPKFVPIIPSLNPNKSDLDDPEFTALLQELLRIPQLQGEKKKDEMLQSHTEMLKADAKPPERDCLKCETFAELQERLGCIDGSEVIMEVLKCSSKVPSVNDVSTKSHPRKENGKHTSTKALKAPQGLLNQGLGCSQTAEGEKKTDGAFPGDSFQREDSGLYDCEECSAASSSEEILNQALGLNTNCCAEHPNTGTPKLANKLPSKSCGETTAGVSPALQSADKQEGMETAEWFKPDKRTSPVGKSSPISPSSSCSSSHSVANSVVHKDVLPNCPAKEVKEMKATITVTVQQPLDLKGQDELVFSMVEEVTISGALNSGRTGGNIICIRDQQHSNTEGSANSQPIRIISNVSEESLAAGSPDNTVVSVVESAATDTTAKPQHQCRREKGFIPSFINPMLIHTDVDCDVDGGKEKQTFQESNARVAAASDTRGNHFKNPEDRNMNEKRKKVFESQTQLKKLEKPRDSAFSEIPYDSVDSAAFGGRSADDAVERGNAGDRRHPGDEEHVFSSSNSNGSSEGGKCIGNAPRRICVLPCCQETAPTPFETGSSPQGWQNANVQDCYLISSRRDTRGMTSSTPCSPGVTPDKRPGRTSPLNHGLQVSTPFKCGTELTQKAGSSSRQGVASVSESSNPRIKHEGISGRQQSPPENSGRLFSARLEQLACKTNSLGRAPRDFPTLYRGSSNTSMSSKGSSRGSNEGACRRVYKDTNEGHCTLPRASRSSRKSHRSDQSHHYSSQISVNQPSKHSHSKLSAVGKLKMAAPKARRLSAPSIKNVSMTHRGLSQSGSRSSSISPESKNDGLEANSSPPCFSSPPLSFQSISRTPSQSSTCSSTKSAIQGFVNGRIAELLKERSASPGSAELDEAGSIPSPYSRLTAPRSPDHLSGHASDTTSVLSGDLPPAMGKTSLYFSNRNSTVSSGYDSLLRDGETASNRDSVSDRSGSLLSATRSSRSSRKKGSTASHQRRPSKEETMSLRRSPSGLRSRWADRGIPEAYEIKVYEIDNLQRMQKRAGSNILQRQTEVFEELGSAEDLRGRNHMHQTEEGAHAGGCHLDPRV